MDDNKTQGAGPIIGTIIILVVIILGGLYFWGARSDDGADGRENTEVSEAQALQSINTQSSADDTASIEADLESTDIDGLNSDF